MRVVIADDHALFMEGIKNLLTARGYQVVGTARDGLEALKLAKTLQPDVMLLDIFMPRCDGLEATKLISAACPGIKLVVLTSSEDEQDVFDAVRYGACGYFNKSFSSDKLFAVMEALQNNEVPVSPGLAGRILAEMRDKRQLEENWHLTDRQQEVLALVAQGAPYRKVAASLDISERTVKYHIQSAIDKLHLQNRQQLISYAAKAGIVK